MGDHEAYTRLTPTDINDWDLPQKSLQIESFTAYENHVLIGTQKGQLLLYSYNFTSRNSRKLSEKLIGKLSRKSKTLINFEKVSINWHFSRKPIIQIEVVPEYKIMFCLTDSIISVHDLSKDSFPIICTEPRTRGASLFILDVTRVLSQTGDVKLVIRICVAIERMQLVSAMRRSLQFYYWKNGTFCQLATDIELNDVPRTLSWIENTVCVGFKTEYALYNQSGNKMDLFKTSFARNIDDPCTTTINGDIFCVVQDKFIIAVDKRKFTPDLSITKTDESGYKQTKAISVSNSPRIMVYDEPYMLAVIDNLIEVHVFESFNWANDDSLIQRINNFPNAKFCVKVSQGFMLCASQREIWGIEGVDIGKQRQQLLETKRFELAIKLTNLSFETKEQKMETIKEIKTHYAYDLFDKKLFTESIDEFVKLDRDLCAIIGLFPNLIQAPVDAATIRPQVILDECDLEKGLIALSEFLTDKRNKLNIKMQNETLTPEETEETHKQLVIIETTLLKCYLETNDSLVQPVLRSNHCKLEESEQILIKYQRYADLIILYEMKGLHEKALQVLKKQAQVEHTSLFGTKRTIQYLQQLGKGQLKLIFEFSGWVLKKHPEDGLKIFTEDIQEVENLPRTEVLNFLMVNHKSFTTPYLEHVINVWKDTKPKFHDILVQEYCQLIKGLAIKKHKKDQLLIAREKLQNFLKESKYYDPIRTLALFPETNLFEERAIVHMREHAHKKALVIYLHVLGDIQKAMEYCNEAYNDKGDKNDATVYLNLIELLLTPPSKAPFVGVELHPNCIKNNIDTVLQIIDNNASKINPHTLLTILPDDIPMHRLKKFLETALNIQLENKRKLQVMRHLYSTENLQLQDQLYYLSSKSVLVTEFSVCRECGKKFSNHASLVRYPNGNIVHFGCKKEK